MFIRKVFYPSWTVFRLTHIQTLTAASAADIFWKHCDKRRNHSWCAIFHFVTIFSPLFNGKCFIYRGLPSLLLTRLQNTSSFNNKKWRLYDFINLYNKYLLDITVHIGIVPRPYCKNLFAIGENNTIQPLLTYNKSAEDDFENINKSK